MDRVFGARADRGRVRGTIRGVRAEKLSVWSCRAESKTSLNVSGNSKRLNSFVSRLSRRYPRGANRPCRSPQSLHSSTFGRNDKKVHAKGEFLHASVKPRPSESTACASR